MSDRNGTENAKRTCHLQWFINARCDYACLHCKPPEEPLPRDLDVDACLDALQSFAGFAADRRREATITFYPRQAAFTQRLEKVLRATAELKRQGRVASIRTANRGDLPDDKVRFFQECGVDTCQLTIDAPEPIQDAHRRPRSFRDTLHAYRQVRAAGMQVVALMIIARFNAPHLTETMKVVLDEGVDQVVIQAGIDANAGRAPVSGGTDQAENPWCQGLSADGYRALLVDLLRFLDTLDARHADFRQRLILETPMFARLFSELGRLDEFECMRTAPPPGSDKPGACLRLQLQPEGTVRVHQDLPRLGAFPGATFEKMFAASSTLQTLDEDLERDRLWAEGRRAFVKCRSCPAAKHCQPALVGASGSRLFYYPDDHCWVLDEATE